MADVHDQRKRRGWLRPIKLLVTLGPILSVHTIVASKGLAAVCTDDQSFGMSWCKASIINHIIVIVVIARFFYK